MARNRASAKKAGTSFETDLAKYLSEQTKRPVKRKAKTGALDTGDLSGVYVKGQEIVVECKSPGRDSSWNIAQWWKETVVEAINNGSPFGILAIRRYRKPIDQSLVVVDDHVWKRFSNGADIAVETVPAKGFKTITNDLSETVIRCPKKGEPGAFWYLMPFSVAIDFVDGFSSLSRIFIREDDLLSLRNDGECVLLDNHGQPVVVELVKDS